MIALDDLDARPARASASVMPVRATSYLHTFDTAVPTTPGNATSPPVALTPAMRPCLLACVPSWMFTAASRTRWWLSTQSPAA